MTDSSPTSGSHRLLVDYMKLYINQISPVTSKPLTQDEIFQAVKADGNIIAETDLLSCWNQAVEELAPKRYSVTPESFNHAIENMASTNMLTLAKHFYDKSPYFYDKNKIWWVWDKEINAWKMIDEIDILNIIDAIYATRMDTIDSKTKNEMMEGLRRVGRLSLPKPAPNDCLQFKNIIIGIETNIKQTPTPDFFFVNPIPWELTDKEETPTMDKLFEEWVGKEYVQTLYDIIAYCLLPSYPLHRVFCFNGAGMNGKSKFMSLISKFLGRENCCSTDLDSLLDSRFESAKLYKKLFCSMGETNLTAMKKTQRLKRLTGEDFIGFEFKNKNPFEDVNYAKICIATNSLPVTYDKTVGFYRRWLIIDFPNQFDEGRDVLKDIPDDEYNNLATKSVRILKELLIRRQFWNEGSIEEKQQKYEDHSNPVRRFINEECRRDLNGKIAFSDFEEQLNIWLNEHQYRRLVTKEITNTLSFEGFEKKRVHNKNRMGDDSTGIYIIGLVWKGHSDIEDIEDIHKVTHSLHVEPSRNMDIMDIMDIGQEKKGDSNICPNCHMERKSCLHSTQPIN